MGIPRKTRKITNTMSLSVCKYEEKRVGKLVHQSTGTIGSLPKDLLVDVLARVASSSSTDLFNAKLCCKEFLESTKDDYIFQHISLDKFPVTHWFPPSQRELSFLTHCFRKGNPESLFRQGMEEYFRYVNVNLGLELLKRAVEKGHSEATYVYGMILLSGGDQSSQQGLNLLNSMNYSRSRHWNVQASRGLTAKNMGLHGIVVLTCWRICKARNEKIFKDVRINVVDIISDIKALGFLWFSSRNKKDVMGLEELAKF